MRKRYLNIGFRIEGQVFVTVRHPIKIIKIPINEGGGYCACLPTLGENTFLGDGDTSNKAVANLLMITREFFRRPFRSTTTKGYKSYLPFRTDLETQGNLVKGRKLKNIQDLKISVK